MRGCPGSPGREDGASTYMYTQYFGLKENPFALSPDPRYLYSSQRHQDALAHLMYGITGGGGFVLLTGEVGTGKTMMIRALLQRLPETVDVALVLYPFLSVREFMVALCDDLRIPRPAENSLKTLIDTLNAALLENHAKGRHTVLIVDEAHRLNREVLEQIRLLTNLETTKDKLLQIVLSGQPELNAMLARPDMRQLAQRITARYHLQALLPRETYAYVLHRCRVAGAETPLFSWFALRQVHRLTGGVPRLVNVLCDRALLATYARGKTRVSMSLVRAAAREMEASRPRVRGRRRAAFVVSLLMVLGLAGLGAWHFAPEFVTGLLGRDAVVQTIEAQATNGLEQTPGVPASGAEVAQPAANAATGGTDRAGTASTTPAPTLAQLLVDPAFPTDTDTAFSMLFKQWGIDYSEAMGGTGCERAQDAGMRCLFESGTWNNLRQINRPAIIELVDEHGTRHHVLVSHLGSDVAVLEVPGKRYEFPLNEIDRVWFGKYLMLWSPPDVGEQLIRRGMRGAPVVWVRDVLQRYGLVSSAASGNDVFDIGLEAQVKEFQRRHQLQDDGIVGRMTLVYLSTYDTHASSPLLTNALEVKSQ
jgi:general secretion pathway protein A